MSLCYGQRLRVRGAQQRNAKRRAASCRGFTLVEVLAATALALLMMGTMVSMFAIIGDSVGDSRATVETTERLRNTQLTLQRDLAGITGGTIAPSRDPEMGQGYFEYIEGPIDSVVFAYESGTLADGTEVPVAITEDPEDVWKPDYMINGLDYKPDTTIGDIDDVIMFTTRRSGEPFVGRADATRWAPSATIQSPVAEVCWFLRGTTLYRRQLLVMPSLQRSLAAALAQIKDKDVDKYLEDFYEKNDLSVHMEGGPWDTRADKPVRPTLVLNSLGDLTKREHRYGHQPFAYPHDARFWGVLGLPTLRDCCFGTNSSLVWPFPFVPAGDFEMFEDHHDNGSPPLQRYVISPVKAGTSRLPPDREVWHVLYHDPDVAFNPNRPNDAATILPYGRDIWREAIPSLTLREADNEYHIAGYGNDSTRISDDIIMTNVISFDVEVWDPGAPIYEKLNDSGVAVAVTPGDPLYVYSVQQDVGSRANPNNPYLPVSYGAFVDLNYMSKLDRLKTDKRMPDYFPPNVPGLATPSPYFHHAGDRASLLRGTRPTDGVNEYKRIKAAVYDTWSTHYEHDGKNQDANDAATAGAENIVDQGTNGLDDLVQDPITLDPIRINGADDITEREAPPPYDAAVKAIRIKIRVFEPDSEQIREVTVVQDF